MNPSNGLDVELTYSLQEWLWRFHKEDMALILLGHVEILDQYWDSYISWCQTEEGKRYLEGGDLWETHKKSKRKDITNDELD
jgi:hypothetical protein